jgi:hypothetical protein
MIKENAVGDSPITINQSSAIEMVCRSFSESLRDAALCLR